MRGQTVVYDFSEEVELPQSQVGVDHPQKQRGVLIVVCLDKRDLIFVPEQFRFSLQGEIFRREVTEPGLQVPGLGFYPDQGTGTQESKTQYNNQ